MKLNLIKSMSVMICAAGTLIAAAPEASAITISASSGSLSAEVIITQMAGNQFTVLLKNTSANDVLVPIDVLTGVFFNYSGGTLTPVSAVLDGSTVLFGFPTGGGNVGGEWAYGSGLAGAPNGATRGISSTGLGLFGSGNFGGSNLEGPSAVNGLGYGITSAGDNPLTGNTPVTGTTPLIKNSVLFTLSYTGNFGTFDNVSFQYGTSLTEPHINVPDGGSTIALLGSALVGVGALRRKLLKA